MWIVMYKSAMQMRETAIGETKRKSIHFEITNFCTISVKGLFRS